MCTFNTLLLPASVQLAAVNAIAREALGQTFTPQENVTIERAVAADARSFVRDTDCDCGMGLAARPDATPPDRELRKLRAAGWSDAKIQRWVDQRAATQQKRHRQHQANRPQAAEWAAFVRRILDERLAPWVGLFTHDYEGSVKTESIEIAGARRFVGVTADQVEMIEEDVPFVFAAR